MSEPQRRRVKCRLCKKEGHNIRSCNLFENTRKEGIKHYESWLHHCIVWYTSNEEERPVYANELIAPDERTLQLFTENRNNANGLDNILASPIEWLRNIEQLPFDGLVHGYNIDKKAPREQVISLLHHVLLCEADVKWMRSFDVEKAVPYLIKSKDYLDNLERANAQIFSYDILLNEMGIIAGLHSANARDDRIRSLYHSTVRVMQYSAQDLSRSQRRLQDVERNLRRIQNELASVQETRDNLVERRDRYLRELSMFPEGCLKPQIEFVETKPLKKIECPICYEETSLFNYVILGCGHEYCMQCILNTVLKRYNGATHNLDCNCPMCRKPVEKMYGNVDKMKGRLQYLKTSFRIQNNLADIIG